MEKWLDKFQNGGGKSFYDTLLQNNGPIVDNTAVPIQLPSNLNYDKTRVVNAPSRGLNKTQLKQVNKNLKVQNDLIKKQELQDYQNAKLFHDYYNPISTILGNTSTPVGTFKPTGREVANSFGIGIKDAFDIPGIGVANDFVNPLSLVSKGIIAPWMQAPLQAQQSDSYLPYAGAALSTALTVPMVRPASIAAKTILNPANIYKGALGAGKYLTEETALKNTYKINPWAFKPNSEAYYRVLGKEGVNDALESGIIRANPKNIDSFSGAPIYDRPFFSKGVPFDRDWKSPFKNKKGKQSVGSIYPDETMVEVFGHDKFHKTGDLVTSPIDVLNSSDEGINFYKRDWLKGYKEVPKPKIFTEGQPYEGAPHIYQDMYPVNGRYQPRTVITDAGVKDEIIGLEATPIIPLNQIEYPVTSNKFLNQTYDDFGRMEEGLVRNTTPSTQESIWNNILKNSSENKKLPGSKTSYSIVRDSEGKIQFLDNESYRDALVTGKGNVVNYLSDPRYKAVVEGNQELANRLNMNRVLPIQKEMGNAGLHDARVAKINQPITILDPRSLETKIIQGTNEGVQAQYSRNLDGSGFLTIPRVYDKTKTIKNVEHEALHHVYPNLGEGLPSFTPLEARKAKAVFKDNATLRKIEEENNIPFWYLDDVDELVPNSFDLANDLGIAKFQKYPGVESFKKMLESYTGGKKFIKDALKLDTPRDYKRAWDMLSGVRLGIVPAVGVGVALQQQKNGGAIITNRGQWDYPGQTTIIPSNQITMTGVNGPLYLQPNKGKGRLAYPNEEHYFPKASFVVEHPIKWQIIED